MTHGKGTIAILTGGGDVPGLNPAIRAITIRALREGYRLVGIRRGWAGLDYVRDEGADNSENVQLLSEALVNRAGRTGGIFLHTSRTRPSHLPRERVPAHLSGYYEPINDVTKDALANLEHIGVNVLIPIDADDTLRALAGALTNFEATYLPSALRARALFCRRNAASLQDREGTLMTTAAQILNSKPDKAIYTTTPAASVFDAVKLMAEKSIGALVVIERETLVGLITERDYARKIVLMARSSRETPVRDIMTSPVMYVRPDQTSEECMALMTENRVRHLPVIDNDKLIGLISIGDLVKDVISEQKFIIQQLEHYIAGERG